MGKKIDLTGQRFGRLVVLKESSKRDKNGSIHWVCKCDCGNIVEPSSASLRKGTTISCGCYNKEIITKDNPKRKRKLYYIYRGIKDRCYNKNSRAYHNYGGRGISISNEWNDYDAFEQWALANGYEYGLWLDRIDNDGDYSPYNCRWVTPKEQQNNKRTNKYITINGITKTLQQWAESSGIKPMTLSRRIELGWDSDELLKPIDSRYSHSEQIKDAMRRCKK
jgi:hypothetical protein